MGNGQRTAGSKRLNPRQSPRYYVRITAIRTYNERAIVIIKSKYLAKQFPTGIVKRGQYEALYI